MIRRQLMVMAVGRGLLQRLLPHLRTSRTLIRSSHSPQGQLGLRFGAGEATTAAGNCVTQAGCNRRLSAQLMMLPIHGVAVAHLVVRSITM